MRDPDEGLRALFEQEYSALVRSLHAFCGSQETAADVVQRAFEQAWRRWDHVSTMDRPGAWVRRVAINEAKNDQRSTRRRLRAVDRMRAEAVQDRSVEAVAARELRDAVTGLPDGQRLAVALHYLSDLSVGDVADAMGVAEGTVKSQLHDARQALARSIGVIHD